MRIATLTFELPVDKYEFDCAINGALYRSVLAKLDVYLRNVAKYQDIDIIEVKEVRQKITELLDEYGLKE